MADCVPPLLLLPRASLSGRPTSTLSRSDQRGIIADSIAGVTGTDRSPRGASTRQTQSTWPRVSHGAGRVQLQFMGLRTSHRRQRRAKVSADVYGMRLE